MKPIHAAVVLCTAVFLPCPVRAVESVYLEDVPVTNPGEYLAPVDFYSLVPPPDNSATAGQAHPLIELAGPLATSFQGQLSPAGFIAGFYGASRPSKPKEDEASEDEAHAKLRVRIVEGVENASPIPRSVILRTLGNSDSIELVGKGEIYDVRVEVETMKLETSPIVFIVINAYKDVGSESLVFYNNFGYLGEQKLSDGSKNYARQLETAILSEFGD